MRTILLVLLTCILVGCGAGAGVHFHASDDAVRLAVTAAQLAQQAVAETRETNKATEKYATEIDARFKRLEAAFTPAPSPTATPTPTPEAPR